MTGLKVDYKKEYALTFGEYTEARNPQVVSNTMAPRTDPCIALYPTLNLNGSWKFYNLRTQMVVARSQYLKIKHTPVNIVSAMNLLAESKGILKSDDVDMGPNVQDDIQGQNVDPGLHVHIPDPNVVEIINDNTGSIDDDTLVEDDEAQIVQEPSYVLVDDVLEPNVEEEVEVEAPPPTRRSARSTAGVTSKYDGYSMMTRGYGLACANLKVKVALERFGKAAYDAIKDDLTQLFIKKRALVPKLLKEICRANLYHHTVRSHMFLREKLDAAGVFEKIKARLVADGSTQDRDDFDVDDITSPTASLESIFNMLKLAAVERRQLLILDVGGAYLNAKIDREVYMYIQPELVNILLNICPQYSKFKDERGRMLVQIDKAMYGLVQSAKLLYDKITGVLGKEGFVSNPMDPCVWNKSVNGNQITIVIYVDDLAISCKNKA